jgi:hypothetical protein
MNQQSSEESYARKPLTVTPINVIQLRHCFESLRSLAPRQTKTTPRQSEESVSNIYDIRARTKNKPMVER